MAGYRLGHDLDEDPTVHDGQVLDEPLRFDGGSAVVADEQTARDLVRRHTHLEYVGPEDDQGPTDEGATATDDFDAEAFVDRTPMSEVVDDLESGEFDAHLDTIEEMADRKGVQQAIDQRRET